MDIFGMARMLFYQGGCGHPTIVPIWEEQPITIKMAWLWIVYRDVDYFADRCVSQDDMDRFYEESRRRTMAKKDLEFGVGDLVQLKSGGPVLTVCNTGPRDNENWTVVCQWFNVNDDLIEDSFDQRVLVDWVEEDENVDE